MAPINVDVMFQVMRFSIDKSRIPFIVYLVGVFVLSTVQGPLRRALGDWLAFAVVIAYLFLLRFIGSSLVLLVERRQRKSIIEHNLQVEEQKHKKRT